ncbi:VC0807 family protein [Streptomyces sp. NPDC048462]|uniref:VC0807 family protein n=1 Tax=Streptomyces sp. NPDC048462 TaxID=3365555 RepID=UPI003712DC52
MGLGRQLGIFAFDIGAPIGCYYLMRSLGFSSLVALASGAVLLAFAAAWRLARTRRVDPVAVLVFATMALSVLLAMWTHSSRFLLAKEGLLTGLWGVVFVASVAFRRPIAFSVARPLMEGRRAFAPASWDTLWADEPAFRRIWRVSSLIWGGALLADAVIRVLMAYWMPVDEVVWLGGLLWPVTFVAINVVTNLYYLRAGLFRLLGARWTAQP